MSEVPDPRRLRALHAASMAPRSSAPAGRGAAAAAASATAARCERGSAPGRPCRSARALRRNCSRGYEPAISLGVRPRPAQPCGRQPVPPYRGLGSIFGPRRVCGALPLGWQLPARAGSAPSGEARARPCRLWGHACRCAAESPPLRRRGWQSSCARRRRPPVCGCCLRSQRQRRSRPRQAARWESQRRGASSSAGLSLWRSRRTRLVRSGRLHHGWLRRSRARSPAWPQTQRGVAPSSGHCMRHTRICRGTGALHGRLRTRLSR